MFYSINQGLSQVAVFVAVPILLTQPVLAQSILAQSVLAQPASTVALPSQDRAVDSSAALLAPSPAPSHTNSAAPTILPAQLQSPLHSQAGSSAPPVACPVGEFASAFPDVSPSDWAYDAVNRLAAVPVRCFPQPR